MAVQVTLNVTWLVAPAETVVLADGPPATVQFEAMFESTTV
jgi:hypothetical protein